MENYDEALKTYLKFSQVFAKEDLIKNMSNEVLTELINTNRQFLTTLDTLRMTAMKKEENLIR